MPKNNTPVSIGRVVHYQAHGSPNGQHKSLPRAAIIAGLITDGPDGPVTNDLVDLVVLNPTGLFFNQGCPYDADGGPGTWRWPPRT